MFIIEREININYKKMNWGQNRSSYREILFSVRYREWTYEERI